MSTRISVKNMNKLRIGTFCNPGFPILNLLNVTFSTFSAISLESIDLFHFLVTKLMKFTILFNRRIIYFDESNYTIEVSSRTLPV